MPKWALMFGAILIGLGLYGYFGQDVSNEGKPSPTALIPAIVGVLLAICGGLGLDQRVRKHAMHAAAGIALLGLLGGGMRVVSKMGTIFSGEISRAMVFVLVMVALCAIYLVLSIRSFVNARKQRESQ